MAATAEAARLSEAHRLAQVRLGAQTVRQIRTAWRLLDPTDLDGTTGRWLRVALPIVQANHGISARLAADYIVAFKTLEVGSGTTPILSRAADSRAVAASLVVTGPASMKAGMTRGEPLARVIDIAEARSARAAMRHSLDGGRGTLFATVEADADALGWARTTSGNPCAFCAMLASRGPVYSKRSVDFQAHDGCHCTAEPVYRRDADWPSGSRQYRELWDEVTAGERDQLNAFRRAFAAR